VTGSEKKEAQYKDGKGEREREKKNGRSTLKTLLQISLY
jgi:hypothetical protein